MTDEELEMWRERQRKVNALVTTEERRRAEIEQQQAQQAEEDAEAQDMAAWRARMRTIARSR